MPQLEIKYVVSSSESEEHFGPENLLNTGKLRAWKGVPGKDASVVLKLEREEQIRFVDIGNVFSAFIDVMVGKSCEQNLEFATLISATFMDPTECRNEKNGNRVKMFGIEQMNSTIAAKKWDLIKIVCRQPFNQRLSFGISFIRLIGGEEKENLAVGPTETAERRTDTEQNPSNTFFHDLDRRIEEREKAEQRAREETARRLEMHRAQRESIMLQARDSRDRKRRVRAESDSEDELRYDEVVETRPVQKRPPKIRPDKIQATTPTAILLDSKGRPLGAGGKSKTTPRRKFPRNPAPPTSTPPSRPRTAADAPRSAAEFSEGSAETPKKGTLLTRMMADLTGTAEDEAPSGAIEKTSGARMSETGTAPTTNSAVVDLVELESSDDEIQITSPSSVEALFARLVDSPPTSPEKAAGSSGTAVTPPPKLSTSVTPTTSRMSNTVARTPNTVPRPSTTVANITVAGSTGTVPRNNTVRTPTSVRTGNVPAGSSTTPKTGSRPPTSSQKEKVNKGILSGVRFTLSGYQNPLRGQIRDKAISLGATCLNDVDSSLTHLISAFKNTPKARQIGANVHVVSGAWVDRCVLEKRRLAERLFAFP